MQTQTAVSAANSLLQAAEAALLKQKKSLASKEFKQAMVACKRCCKFKKEEGGISSKKFITSSRGWCRNCNAMFCLCNMHSSYGVTCKRHQMKPILTLQIVEYIYDENSLSLISSSDRDSDSEERFVTKMCAYPKSNF